MYVPEKHFSNLLLRVIFHFGVVLFLAVVGFALAVLVDYFKVDHWWLITMLFAGGSLLIVYISFEVLGSHSFVVPPFVYWVTFKVLQVINHAETMAVSSRIFVSMSTFVVVVSGLTCALWFISNRPLFKKRRVLDQINQLIAVFSGILVVFVIANFSVLFWGFSLAEGLIANNMLGDCCQNPNALVQLMHWVLGYPVITLGIVIYGLLFRRQQLLQ